MLERHRCEFLLLLRNQNLDDLQCHQTPSPKIQHEGSKYQKPCNRSNYENPLEGSWFFKEFNRNIHSKNSCHNSKNCNHKSCHRQNQFKLDKLVSNIILSTRRTMAPQLISHFTITRMINLKLLSDKKSITWIISNTKEVLHKCITNIPS